MTKHNLGSTVFLNLVGNGARIVFSFAGVMLAARFLGAHDFGTVSIILGYTAFLQYLLALGFDHGLTFYVARSVLSGRFPRAVALLKFSILVSLALAVVLFLPAFFLLPKASSIFSDPAFWLPFLVIGAQMEIGALSSVMGGFLRGAKRFVPVIVKDQFLFPGAQLLFIVAFIKFMDMGIMGYAWAYALASAAGLVYMLPAIFSVLRSWSAEKPGGGAVEGYGEYAAFSFPIAVMNTLEPLFIWIGVVIMSHYLPPGDIGVFSVAFRTTVFLHFFFKAVMPIFSPYMAEAHHAGDSANFSDLYRTVNVWCLKWVLCVLFLLLAVPGEILSVFGAEYVSGVNVLLVMLPGLCFEGVFGGARMTLVMAGRNKLDVLNYLVVIALNAAAVVLTVPRFGVLGGAASVSAMFIVLNLMRIAEVYAATGATPFSSRQVWRAAFYGVPFLAVGASISLVSLPPLLKVLLAGVLFSAGLLRAFWSDRTVFIAKLRRKAA